MADTRRTLTEILALFADNSTAQISAQDLRDFVVSVLMNHITEVVDPAYEIAVDDVILHVSYTDTGVVAITWPTAQITNGRIIDIKDAGGNSATNPITITPESGTIEGAASFDIDIDSASYTIYCYGGNLFIK